MPDDKDAKAARDRGRTTGPKGQTAAAERRARWERDFARLRELVAQDVPELAAPEWIGGHLAGLAAATSPTEWNNATAALVARLFRLAGRDGDRCTTAQYQWVAGRIVDVIARGFVAPSAPVANMGRRQHDAAILDFERPATLAEAVAALDRWERDSLLPGQVLEDEPEKTRGDRLRKRAERAAKHAGIEIKRRSRTGSGERK